MTEEIREYDAIFFRQPGNEKYIMATFVVGASDLIEWAGVPRKKDESAQMISFQRSLDDKRLEKIQTHFKNCVTPNSILITTSEKNIINLEDIEKNLKSTKSIFNGKLKIKMSELNLDLETSINEVLIQLKNRVSKEELIIDNASIDKENNIEDESPIIDDVEVFDDNKEFNDLEITAKSHLIETIKFLEEFLNNYKNDNSIYSEEEINDVTSFCSDFLKPAFLVDGQHRTFGAYHEISDMIAKGDESFEILLPVCAIINSDWKESVFQFVIINQTAKRIDSKFLSSIISTSLTDDELSGFRTQLEESGAPVGEAVLINELNSREYSNENININPFYMNIEFGVENESENLLRYGTIKSLVNRIRNFKDVNNVVFSKPYQNFQYYLKENNISLDLWKQKYWIDFMVYFWHLCEKKFILDKKLRYEIYKEIIDDKGKVESYSGTNLSFKISMEYLQDSFINYITKNSALLKKLDSQVQLENGMITYSSIEKLFNHWCDDHKKDAQFFEKNWKGFSSFKRVDDKFEGINSSFTMDNYTRSKLFKG